MFLLTMVKLFKGVSYRNLEYYVYLDQACNAKFESQLHYDRNVSGTL